MVRIIAQVDRIIRVIHSSVPEELWPQILRKIDGPVAADTPMETLKTRRTTSTALWNPHRPEEDCWTVCPRRD